MKLDNKKYRLRANNLIVGYAESTSQGFDYLNSALEKQVLGRNSFKQIDRFTGIKDKFHRDIYENDLVAYKISHEMPLTKGVVIYDEISENFGVMDLETKHITALFVGELCLFHKDKMEIYSHIFNHQELQQKLFGDI